MDGSLVLIAFAAAGAAGLATGVGALPVFFVRKPGPSTTAAFLGFAAGVMLAASIFSLILPGLEAAQARGYGETQAALAAAAGVLLGAGVMHAVNRWAPHEHFVTGPEHVDRSELSRIWLFVIAITLHNVPEGLAVGVAFGDGDLRNGTAAAIGIGVQNMPEGLAVAAALASLGYRRVTAFGVALLTGLVEPFAGLAGALAVSAVGALLPWALTFAAGAMIWVVSSEIIPETHRGREKGAATAALMIGFAGMMVLDLVLG